MKKNLHFCGIFAIAMVALTTIAIASCDKDDEVQTNEEEYTLADRLMTRAAEGGLPQSKIDSTYYQRGSISESLIVYNDYQLSYTASWEAGDNYSNHVSVQGSVSYINGSTCCEPSSVTFSNAYINNKHVYFTYSFTHHFKCHKKILPQIYGDVIMSTDTVATKK